MHIIDSNVDDMKPPAKPCPEDCCNSGCNPCIFDVYDKQLQRYEKFLETGHTTTCGDLRENLISQLDYTKFKVLETADICESYKLLTFKHTKQDECVWWKPGDHFLMKYNDGSKSCTRAYTPIKLKDKKKMLNYDFMIIVRIYNDGLVSKYLSTLKPEDETLWRGPYGAYEYVPNTYKRIIMIAQGTGVVSFLSIIEQIINNEEDMTKIILYYCCPSADKILMRDILYEYKSFWNFNYKIFLTNTLAEDKFKYQEPINNHRFSISDLIELTPFVSEDQYLICGSAMFMDHYKTLLEKEKCTSENIKLF